jgi:hypothetical protein
MNAICLRVQVSLKCWLPASGRETYLKALQEWESALFVGSMNQWTIEDNIANDIVEEVCVSMWTMWVHLHVYVCEWWVVAAGELKNLCGILISHRSEHWNTSSTILHARTLDVHTHAGHRNCRIGAWIGHGWAHTRTGQVRDQNSLKAHIVKVWGGLVKVWGELVKVWGELVKVWGELVTVWCKLVKGWGEVVLLHSMCLNLAAPWRGRWGSLRTWFVQASAFGLCKQCWNLLRNPLNHILEAWSSDVWTLFLELSWFDYSM